jgi:enolase
VVAVQAIQECGFVPDRDVCLALDPAASELSNAYREKTGEKGSVGQYLFWRAEDPKVLTTDEMVDLYVRWVRKYPIVSIEDGFAEDDYEGWRKLMAALDKDILTGRKTALVKIVSTNAEVANFNTRQQCHRATR